MLAQILVRDFAVVEHAELDLAAGMTALTGETGAGKSIVVDALGLALGQRADAGSVRHGAERAEVAATFVIEAGASGAEAVTAWLQERDLDDAEGTCVVRRVVSREGRSRAYVNGAPLPVQGLRELGELLVDIHGQHEHQSLLRRDQQRRILDSYAALGPKLDDLACAHQRWRRLKSEQERLAARSADRSARLDLLRFQVEELQAFNLGPEELPVLESEQSRLAHVEQLICGAQSVLDGLQEAEDIAVDSTLGRCVGVLSALARIDTSLAPATELLQSALIQIREAVDELRRHASALEADPERLQEVESRLARALELGRKHRVSPEALPATLEQLQTELAELETMEQRGGDLEREMADAEQSYRERAEQLSELRRGAAAELAARVSGAMPGLGMQGGTFDVEITHLTGAEPTTHGLDQVDFMVAANPGQPLQLLGKVASGGELSRISLAIQVIAADESRVPTLVFDEVDTGIGGATAEVVGRLLRELGEHTQVLCVTHLPQVAAQAHHHFQVQKQVSSDHARTRITLLDRQARVEELARMLGGVALTDRTLDHAREMIDQAGAASGG